LIVALGGAAPAPKQQLRTITTLPGPGNPSSTFLELIPVGCSSCQSGLLSATLAPPELPRSLTGIDLSAMPSACGGCGNGPPCVPGRKPCAPYEPDGYLGRFFGALYDCICCPDPCYEGKWYPAADAAMFCEAVRPIIQTRMRWDSGQAFILPDRNEFFWARADGNGLGPKPKAPFLGERRLRHNDLILITEGGTATASLAVETVYRNLQADQFGHASGFNDMVLTSRTLLFDCELLQFAMLFRTHLPTGNASKGLGVGHTSLEPGAVVGIKLTPTTYLQTQVSQWIPLGGNPAYAGLVLHYHTSVNQELCRIMPDVPVLGTFEFAGYSFQDGNYTDPVLGSLQKSSGYTYAYLGGGMRLFVCDKIDFGIGALFAVSRQHFAREFYRSEFRVRW
jgi:hypothetical protein